MSANLLPLRPSGSQRPLFCFPGAGGEISIFHEFAERISYGQPVYVVDMKPFYQKRSNFLIDELAIQCHDLIRGKQESGPYYLCGYSFGAYIAYEVAVLLSRRGEDIGVLALFDAPNPAFQSNLSSAEYARLKLTYVSSRLKKYGLNLISGNFTTLAGDAAGFLISRVDPIWFLVNVLCKFMKKPLPKIFQRNDPIVTAACHAYSPSPYNKRLVIFKSLGRGAEYDQDSTLGWDKCTTGGIDVHFVPGNHIDMMEAPHVLRLLEMLEPYLDDGQRCTAGSVPGLQPWSCAKSGRS